MTFMTPEQLEVHKRLSSSLPVRTHISYDESEKKNERLPKARKDTRQYRVAVIVNGKRYESMAAAGRALGKKRQSIDWMIFKGEAEIA